MPEKKKSFESLLTEAIDKALASLGESSKQSIYFHLERKFKIAKKDIPFRLKDFAEGLEKIFGLGAQFIEILIMKNLFEKIGISVEWKKNKELGFIAYVEAAKQGFSKNRSK